jgi:hypothetical protein
MPTSDDPQIATVLLGCSKCGTTLPIDAQFCLKCGKPVGVPAKKSDERIPDIIEVGPSSTGPQPRKRRTVLWVLLALVVLAILWTGISDNPFAQGMQELVGWKHDQTILDNSFTVSSHSFRYYKFALPEGSVNVAMVGHFSASTEASKNAINNDKNNNVEDGIEVYVLSEPAFTVWQKGFATSSVYESGRIQQGTLQSELPAGAGIYYLVFNNKFSSKSAKNVNATVVLRYKSWLPDSIRRMKAKVSDWLGI